MTPAPTETLPTVRIETADDDDARKLLKVLAALGYRAVRVFSDGGAAAASPEQRYTRALAGLALTHGLTLREQEVALLVTRGETLQRVADTLGICRETVKWHSHNIYTKTGTSSASTLLRKVFDLAIQGL